MEKDFLGFHGKGFAASVTIGIDCPTIRIVERIVSKIALNVSWQSPIERRKSRGHFLE